MIPHDVVPDANATEALARRARPSGTELLIDVRARVVLAQALIANRDFGEALMVLEDLEDDLEASLEDVGP